MINYIKKWYVEEYQQIAYYISVTKAEYDKIGSFVTPTLIVIGALKLFFLYIQWGIIPIFLISVTLCAIGFGRWLVKLGVPKKNAAIGNKQNPEIMRILEILERK